MKRLNKIIFLQFVVKMRLQKYVCMVYMKSKKMFIWFYFIYIKIQKLTKPLGIVILMIILNQSIYILNQ